MGLNPSAQAQIEKIYKAWKKEGKNLNWVKKMKNAKKPKYYGGG